jgi:hypothetical protein
MVSPHDRGGIDLTDDPWAAIDRLTEGIDDALLRAEPARYGRALPVTDPGRERRKCSGWGRSGGRDYAAVAQGAAA